MRLFDPFVHASERTAEDHERMSLEGLTALLEPVRSRGGPWSHPSSFLDHVRDLVEHEPRRLEVFGPRHLQALALPAGGVADLELAMSCIEQLRPWLEMPTVVAIGALGPGGGTPQEEEILKRHLDLAAETALPALLYVPPEDAAERTARTIAITVDMALDPEDLLLVSDDGPALVMAHEAGFWIGLPVGPGARFEPAAAVDLVMRRGPERTLVGSAADGDASDALALPAFVREARREDMSWEELEALLWRNPVAFFGRSGKLDDMR